jgi:hypothetical protein
MLLTGKKQGEEIDIFFQVKEYKKETGEIAYSIEHPYLLMLTNNGNLVMIKEAKNKYRIFPFYSIYKKYHRLNAVISSPEPNQIGKFTDKKINEWLGYCDSLIQQFSDKAAQQDKEAEEKSQEILKIVNKYSMKGAKITSQYNGYTIEYEIFRIDIIQNFNQVTENIKIKNGNAEKLYELLK